MLYWQAAGSKAEKNSLFLTKRNLNKKEPAEQEVKNSSSQTAFRFTLNKAERIKSKKIIDGLFENGSSFFLPPLRVVYKYEIWEEPLPCKVGFTVSKRNFKKAVDRNKVKRLMRETYRINKKSIYDYLTEHDKQLAVIFIYTANALPAYDKLNLIMQQAIKRLTGQK